MRAVVYSPAYDCDIGTHVFPTAKYPLVLQSLLEAGEVRPEQVVEPEVAGRDLLELVHTREYLDDFLNLRPTRRVMLSELPPAARCSRRAARSPTGLPCTWAGVSTTACRTMPRGSVT
jgi:acetoin utilization deacetylase AcuC-like enzyme